MIALSIAAIVISAMWCWYAVKQATYGFQPGIVRNRIKCEKIAEKLEHKK